MQYTASICSFFQHYWIKTKKKNLSNFIITIYILYMCVHFVITSSVFSRVHNVCSVCAARRQDWEDDIYSQLTPGANANLTNSDQSLWFNDAWQIARVFMGSGREASTAGCGDTIALVLNCKLFDTSISNRQSFEEASNAIYLL